MGANAALLGATPLFVRVRGPCEGQCFRGFLLSCVLCVI